MSKIQTLCIVTPCLNSEELIEGTVTSVLDNTMVSQKKIKVNYIVKDGGSSDNTVQQVNALIDKYVDFENINIRLISGKDSGMYDAIVQAFKAIDPGDIYCYLNAGDYYSAHAFEIITEIFSYGVSWLTGYNCVYNEKNHLVHTCLPIRYKKNLLLKGFYGTYLPFIQQESTFWTADLHHKIDFNALGRLKYAGDYYLWQCFIQHAPLDIVQAWLGGFKKHDNQLSSMHFDEYISEIKKLRKKPGTLDFIKAFKEKIIWRINIKRLFNKRIYTYNTTQKKYRNQSPN